MRATTPRPGGKLMDLRSAEREFGLPYAQLLDLAKRGEIVAVQPPGVRRIFLVRAAFVEKLESWRIDRAG